MSPFPFGISIQVPWNLRCQRRSQSHHILSNNHHIWSNHYSCKINHNLYTSRNINENCYGTISLAGSTQISEIWCVRKNIPRNKWNDVHKFMVTLLWLLIENFFFASAEISFFKLNCNYAEIIVFAELLSMFNKMSSSWPGWFFNYACSSSLRLWSLILHLSHMNFSRQKSRVPTELTQI